MNSKQKDPQARGAGKLTKFERVQIVGMRMEQIARGAPPTVEVKDGWTVRDVVLAEIENKSIPIKVKRTLPNGKIETYSVDELT